MKEKNKVGGFTLPDFKTNLQESKQCGTNAMQVICKKRFKKAPGGSFANKIPDILSIGGWINGKPCEDKVVIFELL